MAEWKTYEVIVSVKARGDFRVADLRWTVEQTLQHGNLTRLLNERHMNADFGRTSVKQRARVDAADKVKARADD